MKAEGYATAPWRDRVRRVRIARGRCEHRTYLDLRHASRGLQAERSITVEQMRLVNMLCRFAEAAT